MRTANFGMELEGTLLKSEDVAKISLQTLLSNFSGNVVDIKLQDNITDIMFENYCYRYTTKANFIKMSYFSEKQKE